MQPHAKRQHEFEEAGDRRQVFLQAAVLVGEIQARVLGEGRERAAGDAPNVKRLVELPQRRLGVGALQVVVGAEQALPAGLARAAGDRAERVATARAGGEEPLRALYVGGDQPEPWPPELLGSS